MKNKYYYNVCIGFNPDCAIIKCFKSDDDAKNFIANYGSYKDYYTIRKSLFPYTYENERNGHYPFQFDFEDGYIGKRYPHSLVHHLNSFKKGDYYYGE